MAADVGIELYEKITADLTSLVNHDPEITRLFKKVTLGTATHVDTHNYATRLGELTTEVLQKYLNAGNLPNGTLYYNIAESTVGQVLLDNYGRVNGFGGEIQDILNQEAGLGLKSVPGEYNSGRIHDLVSNIANCDELDHARELLGEPIVNTTQSYADALVKANADFHYECGLTPIIRRAAHPDCCKWCAALEGVYQYPLEEDSDVYHRHENCRCVTTYHPSEGKHRGQAQDVWTKTWNGESLKTFNL
ncbi:MAG: hypothetical protein LUD72_04045 [Bacteroidales bacterium]|nr:hypothetical protein [Bacteroidales bacterium]